MDDQSEHTCDLCKISYASETELEDHVWSFIHHVKIEQRKKGCTHTCSLCLTTCENIIEYGKHLNEDKHKHALSRKKKDPNSPDILDSFRDVDSFGRDVDSSSRQFEREPEFREPEPVTNRKQWRARNQDRGSQDREYRGGHSRSYSEPEIDTNFNQDYGRGHVRGNSKKWNKKHRDRNFNPPGYWEGTGYEEKGYNSQWGGGEQNFWNGPQGDSWGNWGAPAGYGQQFGFQGLYTNFDDNLNSFSAPQQNWMYGNATSFKDLAGNFSGGGGGPNRRGSFDSSAHDREGRGFFDQEQRGRGRTRGNGRDGNVGVQGRGQSKDKSSPDSNSSNDSNGLKRRRDDDHEFSNGKLRKGNSNKRIMEVPRPLTPGDDYVEESVESLLTSKPNARKSNIRDRSSSRDRLAESLPVRMETSPSKRSKERSKQVTWASDTVSSTTDIDHDQHRKKHGKGGSPVSNKRSSSLDTALKRNKLPDSTSDKKVEKTVSSGKDSGKLKTKGKSRQGSSPVSAKRSSGKGKDEGESVLERAEKLCKKLRDEREKGKKDKILKEKQKKMDKHKELNSQINELTEKNKAKIKGHLEAAESMLDKNSSGTVSEESTKKTKSSSKRMGALEKAAVSLGIPIEFNDGDKSSSSSKENMKKGQFNIEKIRETIENSVRTEIGDSPIHSASKSSSQSSPKPESAFPSPLAKHMLSKQKSDSSSAANYDTDHLLKMVNSPRSTKERLRIAQMLRTYAKSQTKLSLPRFNLKMSDLCSGSGDRQDEIAPLDLEQMSPHVQLEIANLIEADVKPDIAELEKLLDFQSAANVMLDVGVLSDLGIDSPNKASTPARSESPAFRAGSPLVLPGSLKQFSSSESAVSRLKNKSVPIKQEHDLIDLTDDTSHEVTNDSSSRGFPSQFVYRSTSPVMKDTRTREIVDNRPSLSIEDLSTDIIGAKESFQHPPFRYKSGSQSLNNNVQSSFPKHPFNEMSTRKSNEPSIASRTDIINIKQEKMVSGYEKVEGISVDSNSRQNTYENRVSIMNDSPYNVNSPARATSPVKQNLFLSSNPDRNISEEIPVRDTESSSPRGEQLTALEKVKSILDEAPNMEKVLGYQQGKPSAVPVTGERPVDQMRGKDTALDISHGSQTSSVLDQVYSISIQEESVRQELSVVNQKISQLQKLMDEAMQQMNKFTEKKESLLKQEDQMRSARMKLLSGKYQEFNKSMISDSRSQSSVGSNPEAQLQSSLSHLTDAQLHNLSNPVFIKFLMSQRNQSDLSSVGGFSNVETGSQFEGAPDGSRRGSFTSNITEPVSLTADRTLTPRGNDETSLQDGDDGKFLTQSVDLLSGSAPSVRSSNLKLDTRATEQISDKHLGDKDSREKMKDGGVNESKAENESNSKMESRNSFSFINSPLDNAGFVTLESLMNQTSDIGKLLQRSLEAEKTKLDCGKDTALQDTRDGSQPKIGNDQNRLVGERERRDSFMSTGSDDIVVSGSDIEKLSGKVSMKYMGTIPDNVNYTEFMKQIASDSKSKSVMYTVVTSPEAVSQLQKFSDSGLGTGSLTSQGLSSQGDKGLPVEGKDQGNNSEGSGNTTGTLTIGDMDFESQSVKSTYSLGEQIKRMCAGQNPDTPEPPKSNIGQNKAFTNDSDKGLFKTDANIVPPQSPSRKMLQSEITRQENLKSNKLQTTGLTHELSPGEMSPTRKRLKSKKERDRKSRRKQKEEFILESSSDTNSVEEESLPSLKSQMILRQPSVPEEDLLVITGSEDGKKTKEKTKTGEESDQLVKKSLLDEVQLETETQSDSCEDRTKGQSKELDQKLKLRPERLESFRSAVKTKLQGGKPVSQSTPVIQYKGPSLSVAAIQVFKEDVYVCYNGSELRRFNLKTGEILKELDCSPYLVQCLLVCSVEEREDILYTGGACKKLMLFKPQKFNLIETYDYDERITCLHGNWGRLFVGLSDGVVSVRSMKTDKELNLFQTTNKSVQCISSTSAGMTKMLCCGCADKIIYVLDAISGILFTMLQGHMSTPLCIEVFDDVVVSGAADKSVLVHNVRSGSLEATIKDHKAMVTQISSDKVYIYTACSDKLVRCYNKQDFKLQRVFYGSAKGMLTSIVQHDGKLLTGNKEGLVESIPVSSSTWTCKCDGCKLQFGLQDHLIHHVMSDHLLPNSRMLQCPWSGCSEWLSTMDGSQKAEEHIISEHFK